MVFETELATFVEFCRLRTFKTPRSNMRGEVIDVAADYGPNSAQIRLALDRIRRDELVTATYGFSGGGY